MDQPITRAEHEEFKRRLEEENSRQDRRIALLEESVSKMGALSTSVEKHGKHGQGTGKTGQEA